MKPTFAFWIAVFVLSFFTAGFFPALLLTGLAVGGSMATGLHVQNQHSIGGSYKKSLY